MRLVIKDGNILGGGNPRRNKSKNGTTLKDGDVLFFEQNTTIDDLVGEVERPVDVKSNSEKPPFILYKFTRNGVKLSSEEISIMDIYNNLPIKDRNMNDAYKYWRTLSEQENMYTN